MEQNNLPPSPPSATPPPPPETVEISLQPETPRLELPQKSEPPDTTEADRKKLIAQAQEHLAQAYDAMMRLTGPAAPQEKDALSKGIETLLLKAGETDALVSYDIRFSNRDGEVFQFTGHSMMHAFSAQNMLSEAPRNFEALLYTTIFRPLKAQVQSYLNNFVTNDNPIPGAPTFGLPEAQSRLPEAGLGPFVSTAV